MLGAIIGDIVGSPYEFDCNNIKTKDFPLFSSSSYFTDDTVLTIAISIGIIKGYKNKEKTRIELIKCVKEICKKYPYSGYGNNFLDWLYSSSNKPYNSCGNGSAMRVSSIAYIYDTLEEVEEYARISSEITHNHKEGIKGAQAVASSIFFSRKGYSKEYIKSYIINKYNYDLSRTCDEIRPTYRHDETCQKTVPEALTAFFEGESFEDVIRLAVSLGGDSDTLTCISGSIAEAYYGIPEELKNKSLTYLDDFIKDKLNEYYEFLNRTINK